MTSYAVGDRVQVRADQRGAGLKDFRGTVEKSPAVRLNGRGNRRTVYEGYVDVRTDAGELLLGLGPEHLEPLSPDAVEES